MRCSRSAGETFGTYRSVLLLESAAIDGRASGQTTFKVLVGHGYRLELVSGYSVGGDDRIAAI